MFRLATLTLLAVVGSLPPACAAPLTPAELQEVEGRVLDARKALRSGQMVIAYWITDGAGKHLPDRDYRVHVWWDGHRVRTDHIRRPADPAPVRHITCWHCDRDGLRFHHSPDPKNPAVIAAAFDPIAPADDPAQQPPDPRGLGLIPFPFLLCQGKPLDILIGRPGRSNVRAERAGTGDREAVTIEFDVSPTLRTRARIEPAKGHAVTRIENLAVGPDGKTVTGTWALETKYTEVPRARAWFPAEFTYTETVGGKEVERHQGRVTDVSLNDRVDPGVFTVAGLGLPPGTAILHVPPDGHLMEWTGTKLKVFDPRKPGK